MLNEQSYKTNVKEGVFVDYRLLSSIYYENKEEYDAVYYTRINGENCIRLNFSIHGNDAFYCIPAQLHDMHVAILELNMKVLALVPNLPPVALEQFAKNSLLDEIVQSNNIEGVHSTRREIDGVLKALEKGDKKKRFYGLVQKYNMMSEENLSLSTCEDIRQIYNELVFAEVRRDDPNNVPDGRIFRKDMAEVTSETGKVIHKGAYPEANIIAAMKQALSILNGSRPAVESIAVFHYLFGYIHPFYDGNGRLSRFISSYLLSKKLNNGLIGYRLSYTIKKNLSSYYKAFEICNNEKNRGDLTPFVMTFTDIVYQSVSNLYTALKKRLDKLMEGVNFLENNPYFNDKNLHTLAFILIQARLFSENGITKKELCQGLDISTSTLDKRLSALRSAGYLSEKNIAHALYFEFNLDKL